MHRGVSLPGRVMTMRSRRIDKPSSIDSAGIMNSRECVSPGSTMGCGRSTRTSLNCGTRLPGLPTCGSCTCLAIRRPASIQESAIGLLRLLVTLNFPSQLFPIRARVSVVEMPGARPASLANRLTPRISRPRTAVHVIGSAIESPAGVEPAAGEAGLGVFGTGPAHVFASQHSDTRGRAEVAA